MQRFRSTILMVSNVTNGAGGVILVLMMLLTVVDVILRYLGTPITGTFELMSFGGALVAGLAIAQTSLDGAHVSVDMLTQALHTQQRDVVLVFTKLVGTGVFALLAWSLFLKGTDLYKMKEVSQTLHVPYYPVAYGLSFCSLVECFVLVSDIVRTIFGGAKHE